MKVIVISNSIANIVFLLLHLESYSCVQIERGRLDKTDFFQQQNCDKIADSFVERNRCRCREDFSSILSTERGLIACLKNQAIDRNCTFVKMVNTARDIIHATNVLNCVGGKITQTEYWNMRSNYSGYWHDENDVQKYTVLEEKENRISLCNEQRLFDGLLLRIKFKCGSENYQCLLVKVYGSREYPITRFAQTNEAPCASVSTITTSTTITPTTTIGAATRENTTKTAPLTTALRHFSTPSAIATSKGSGKPLTLNPPDDDRNVVIVIATVASVATLIIIILVIYIRRRAGRKQKGGQENIVNSTEQQNTGQSKCSEAQKSDAYDYTTIAIKSSPKTDGPKPQYSELGFEYQDIKPVYSELSADHQTYVDEPFYREVDEPDRAEFPQPFHAIYQTVEDETPTYEENNYYSAVETLPDELSSPAAVYAKVKK